MDSLDSLSGSHNFFNIFRVVNYKRKFALEHPTYFYPEGLLVFCSEQGAGKTLSAVQYCIRVNKMYEDCIFCTNVLIKGLPVNCYYEIKEISEDVTQIFYYRISDDCLARKVTLSKDENGEIQTDIE